MDIKTIHMEDVYKSKIEKLKKENEELYKKYYEVYDTLRFANSVICNYMPYILSNKPLPKENYERFDRQLYEIRKPLFIPEDQDI